tara:strand:- start:717 stop:914 length:198 start_codon:yes stop_codon:yes gene_type:complete
MNDTTVRNFIARSTLAEASKLSLISRLDDAKTDDERLKIYESAKELCGGVTKGYSGKQQRRIDTR